MREVLDEFLLVLASSTRTQLALLFGLVFFVVMMAAGNHFATQIELHGALAPLTEVVRAKIAHHYDKAAWATLWSFLFLAVKSYKKDRKRLIGF